MVLLWIVVGILAFNLVFFGLLYLIWFFDRRRKCK